MARKPFRPARSPRVAFLVIGLGIAMLVAPALASADTRYAEPGGNGAEPCELSDPCDIVTAVMGNPASQVADGDEIVLQSGTYEVGASEIYILKAIDVHGVAGQPVPKILTAANVGVYVGSSDATLERVAIEGGDVAALWMQDGTADGVSAHASGAASSRGCLVLNGLIRNSLCWASGNSIAGIGFDTSGDHAVTLRNVTAVSTAPTNSYGLRFRTFSGGTTTVDAKGVIASGVTGDVSADGVAGGSTDIALDHSNFADSQAEGTATVTAPGSPTNQIGLPLFVDAASGDFHQAAGSPTINAGAVDGLSGSADIDGDSRTVGSAPDIGADEYVPPLPPPPGAKDTQPPETTIVKAAKKRSSKRKAKFAFRSSEAGSRFECSFDRGAFASCASPLKRKVKIGKHRFEVRAIDAAGNADQTPASHRWKVKRR